MKTMKQKIIVGIFGVWAVLFNGASTAHACSVCITGASDPSADAFNWSVFFLMAAPYTVVGSIAGWLFYNHRRSAAAQQKSEAVQPPVQIAFNPEESGR
jgi:hypothetical protein